MPTRADLGLGSAESWDCMLSVFVNGTAVHGSPFQVKVFPSVEVFIMKTHV